MKTRATATNSLLPTLLLVLFIGLKLTGQITWPWVWVLAPAWIPAAVALAVVGCVALFIGIVGLWERWS